VREWQFLTRGRNQRGQTKNDALRASNTVSLPQMYQVALDIWARPKAKADCCIQQLQRAKYMTCMNRRKRNPKLLWQLGEREKDTLPQPYKVNRICGSKCGASSAMDEWCRVPDATVHQRLRNGISSLLPHESRLNAMERRLGLGGDDVAVVVACRGVSS